MPYQERIGLHARLRGLGGVPFTDVVAGLTVAACRMAGRGSARLRPHRRAAEARRGVERVAPVPLAHLPWHLRLVALESTRAEDRRPGSPGERPPRTGRTRDA